MILDKPRAEVQRLAQQGELNIKSLTHYDICEARKTGKTYEAIASQFNMTWRGVFKVVDCKCPELKGS